MEKAVVLASGGIESSLIINKLIDEGIYVIGLFFDFGAPAADAQFHCANLHLRRRGHIERISLKALRPLFLRFMTPEDLSSEGDVVCPDVKFTPVFMSVAAFFGESDSIKDIYVGTTIEQSKEMKKDFYSTVGPFFASYQSGVPVTNFVAPFISMTKSEVIKKGTESAFQFEKTWSCNINPLRQCGVCPSCKGRKSAFMASGVKDPTVYSE